MRLLASLMPSLFKIMEKKPIIDGKNWILVNSKLEQVFVGDVYNNFRGEPCEITGGQAPKHEASTGRICTADGGWFFPSVCKLEWYLISG
jgi:hypothetical protein